LEPGFLIGGIPGNFGVGARFPKSSWVIVEGDEYDTAFFDKRPKFHHYWPRTLILHNLEFDHADIYPDLESIRQQFRLLLRLVPRTGVMLVNHDDLEMRALVERHHALYGSSVCSPVVWYGLDHGDGAGGGVRGRKLDAGGSHWQLLRDGDPLCEIHWGLLGEHNIINGVAAAAAALHHGIPVDRIRHGLESFTGVARRLQRRFLLRGVQVYDDFAHHPTAIATTLAGLRAAVGAARIWVVLEPRSNTMRLRIHQDRLPAAFMAADRVLLARPAARGLTADQLLDVDAVVATLNDARPQGAAVIADAADAVSRIAQEAGEGDHVVIMSNGGFDGIHERLRQALAG
jgi:UDP-N-acetylmuramate: L-alanyl-gamma-D-glutamyl-meso-diaminopimelate ligase